MNPLLDKAKRKRARYVAGTIGLVLRQHKKLGPNDSIFFCSTIGQMRFIRQMLNRAAR